LEEAIIAALPGLMRADRDVHFSAHLLLRLKGDLIDGISIRFTDHEDVNVSRDRSAHTYVAISPGAEQIRSLNAWNR